MEKKSFWSFSFKDIFYIVIVLGIVGVGGYFGYKMYKDLNTRLDNMNTEYKQLSETLARAESTMATKDELGRFAKQLGVDIKTIQSDMDTLDASIKAVGRTVATLESKLIDHVASDYVIPHDPPEQPATCELCDIHKYTANTQAKDIMLGEMPHARVEFDAASSEPWSIAYDEIDVNVDTVLGEDDETKGKMIFYHEISLTNKSRATLGDKQFKLKVVSSEFKQFIDTTKHWYWWAPHIDFQLDNILMFDSEKLYTPGLSLGMSIMGYGLTENDLVVKVLRVGVGINAEIDAYLILEPIKYNIGAHIPLISDLWLSAGVTYDFSHWGLAFSIGTTL